MLWLAPGYAIPGVNRSYLAPGQGEVSKPTTSTAIRCAEALWLDQRIGSGPAAALVRRYSTGANRDRQHASAEA